MRLKSHMQVKYEKVFSMTFLDRFKAFLNAQDIPPEGILAWERKMGFGKDSIKKFVDGKIEKIGTDRIEKIISEYPRLDLNWLFSGAGKMYLRQDSSSLKLIEVQDKLIKCMEEKEELKKNASIPTNKPELKIKPPNGG